MVIIAITLLGISMMTGCGDRSSKVETAVAVYLGVKDYGKEETNKDNRDEFLYRFEINGKEVTYKISNGTKDEEGNYDYPIQSPVGQTPLQNFYEHVKAPVKRSVKGSGTTMR